MKYLFILLLISFIVASTGAINSAIDAHKFGVGFFEANYPDGDTSFVLPPTWHIRHNNVSNKYILSINDDKDLPEFTTYMMVYKHRLFFGDIWTTSDIEEATKFTDTTILKFYARLMYDDKIRNNSFK